MIDALAFTILVVTPVLLFAVLGALLLSGGDFPRLEAVVVRLTFAWTIVALVLCAYVILINYWNYVLSHELAN